MYKLIAVDLDGTLLNSQKYVSRENRHALKCAMDKGVKVVVCSGRIFAGARIFAGQIETNEPVIACNGAVIKEMSSSKVIYSNSLSAQACCEIIDVCHKEDIYFHVYIGDTMYTERLEYSSLFYWNRNAELSEEDKVDIRLTEDIKRVVEGNTDPIAKVVVISRDGGKLSKARRSMEFVKTIDITSSNYDNFEVINHGVSKWNALKYLIERMKIQPGEVIAIGDNENDSSMIKNAGLGIAMGNAEEYIKQIADYVTLDNDQNGVAEAVKEFIL
ncbi:hypothetical protein DFR58_106120 [Anaerobacterium chartisolvens]|uniref:Cof subfamily protein (Haloacid dehalogenase superfamily)/HAD superfamily hydrolase (TIGR01484 family) n=1 Tax=Anaerobacterium chartisolvens TaxID=1297424 RepID=A0A369B8U6_9FIRM|nr:Cof-type HAD-IIB family hydrolase [Anaerobacterium chartisolvens]RCX17952.1 hypothetical protein DFR58_106120 [Anaerobacterium chartisolvens]